MDGYTRGTTGYARSRPGFNALRWLEYAYVCPLRLSAKTCQGGMWLCERHLSVVLPNKGEAFVQNVEVRTEARERHVMALPSRWPGAGG